MAFLDNSGDIILDAVITEIGRKRMAQGRFRISKFALGDDEIDYSLYDKTHPSGAAYYDLEILQTPIFEAMPQSAVSYGLTSHTRNDLLYMPELKVNTLLNESLIATGNMYYLSVNQETTDKLNAVFGSKNYILESGVATGTKLIFEVGIDNDRLAATKDNQRSYLGNTNMYDRNIYTYVDNRFINGVMGPAQRATFRNTSDGKINVNFGSLRGASATSATTSLRNYNGYMLNAVQNNITEVDTVDISSYTAIKGPKSAAGCLNFSVPQELKATSTGVTDSKYTLYGTVDETTFGGSDKYCYIDTTAYIEGSTTSAQAQIPIRIIRYSG
tara:strand:+ start:349 stop:1335 length:987 start_codon:yes stop_codon:yes gene_type:complete